MVGQYCIEGVGALALLSLPLICLYGGGNYCLLLMYVNMILPMNIVLAVLTHHRLHAELMMRASHVWTSMFVLPPPHSWSFPILDKRGTQRHAVWSLKENCSSSARYFYTIRDKICVASDHNNTLSATSLLRPFMVSQTSYLYISLFISFLSLSPCRSNNWSLILFRYHVAMLFFFYFYTWVGLYHRLFSSFLLLSHFHYH